MSSPSTASQSTDFAALPGDVTPAREAGAVWLGRLRLEEPLAFGANGNWWLATDLRTGRRHSIEFLDAPDSSETAARWAMRFSEATGAMPAGVLRFFRAEKTSGVWLAVSGESAALQLAADWSPTWLASRDPLELLTGWSGIARAVAALHENSLTAHGAISPARIARQLDGGWLLTGYPTAALQPLGEIEFASPARRAGKPADVADDIFSLGALAYYALTGGATPPLLGGGVAPSELSIDAVRRARNLPAAPELSGILQTLREMPSLRPSSVRALLDSMTQAFGSVGNGPVAAPRRMRRPPSWRRGSRDGANDAAAAANPATGGAILPADWLQKLSEERTQLARERAAAARHQEQLAADLERSAGERREIESLQHQVQREQQELTAAQRDLQAAQAAATELRAKLATLESGLAGREDQVGARLQEFTKREAELHRAQTELQAAQQQVASRTAENDQAARKLSAERATHTETQTRLERQSIALNADRDKLRTEQEQLARDRDAATNLRDESERRRLACEKDERRLRDLGGELERRGTELEARDKALQEVQRTIAAMAGGADVNKWLAFASQVEARAAAQEKRTAELEALEQKHRARTAELEAEQRRIQELTAAAQKLNDENAQRRAELDAEKSQVSRLHHEAQQALEVVRRAARPSRTATPATPTPSAAETAPPAATTKAPPLPPQPPPKEARVAATVPESAPPLARATPETAATGGTFAPPPPLPSSATTGSPPLPTPTETAAGVPSVATPAPVALRATLEFDGARRLHIFGGPKVHFGRHGQSDIILIAIVKGQREPTLAVNKEISRKHFELHADATGVRVRDGWSEEPGPVRTSGICIDGRRVDAEGANLHSGSVLSVTTRPLSRAIPHWEVTLFGAQGKIARNAPVAGLVGVYLKRLDDAPDDLLVLLDQVPLAELPVASASAPPDTLLISQPSGLASSIGGQADPLVANESPFPGAKVLSVGFTSPTVSLS